MSLYDATTFEEFWHHYEQLHASRQVRIAHAVATTSALGLLAASLLRRSWKLALAAPLVDYTIAQASHRLEGTATHPLRRPLWHARAELRLWKRTLTKQPAA